MQELKVQPQCIPCFFRQVLIALEPNSLSRDNKLAIMRDVMKLTTQLPWDRTPAHTTTHLHRRIMQLLGKDPFEDRKRRYNRIAMSLLPHLKEKIKTAAEPLEMALRIAVAGNVIDFGIFTEEEIEAQLERALEEPLYRFDYEEFKKTLQQSKDILYLLDNSGEIVFDRVLIELLVEMGKQIIAVVKGSPVLNDATMEDAKYVGLDRICSVVDNGSFGIGTILEWCSEDFREIFSSASMIISKGQGNLETLYTVEREIFFLFQVKCEVVSQYLSVPNGKRLVLYKGGAR